MRKETFWTGLPDYIKAILVIAAFVILTMIIIYPLNVGFHLSHESANWGQFGDYFNLIVAIINTVAVLFLGYLVYKAQNKRDDWERYYTAIQEKPLLRFIAWEGNSYRLYNMGKGPAHKVIIGKIPTNDTVITVPTYKGYSIPSNAYLNVDWSTNSSVLYAYYEGELEDHYLVRCQHDENTDLSNCTEKMEAEAYLKKHASRKDIITIHSF